MILVLKKIKKFFLIFVVLVGACTSYISGTYVHTANCLGMGGQILKLNKNHCYEYIIWGDLMPTDTITGKYHIFFNNLVLGSLPPFDNNKQKGFVKLHFSDNADSSVLIFYSLPLVDYCLDTGQFNRHKNDTSQIMTKFMINNRLYYTNIDGYIKVKLQPNDTIYIFVYEEKYENFFYVVKERHIDTLKIFYPFEEVLNSYTYEKFKIRGNGLYPEKDRFITEHLVKRGKNYKCINHQARRKIRDSVSNLIKQNIDKNFFEDSFYDDFYIVFNKRGKVKKVILSEFCRIDHSDDNLSFSLRQKMKKSLKKYKIPYFKKINYNLYIRLQTDNIYEE